jgi:superfamily II helicase
MITVHFDDFTEGNYETENDVVDAVLEAHAEGVGVDYIEDEENEKIYSLIWNVKLQEES